MPIGAVMVYENTSFLCKKYSSDIPICFVATEQRKNSLQEKVYA